jgi:YVTN family beta-propeller protein
VRLLDGALRPAQRDTDPSLDKEPAMHCHCLLILAAAILLPGAQTVGHADEGPAPRILPGQRADGSMLLHNQWSLTPAGTQVEVANFPVNIAIHPRGRYAAVLHCGYGRHEIVVVDIEGEKVVSRTPVEEAFYGLVFSHQGEHLYCSGASSEGIRAFSFTDGQLADGGLIPLRDASEKGIPCGLAISADGRRLYIANVWGQSVGALDLVEKKPVFDLRFSVAAPVIVIPPSQPLDDDSAAASKRAEAARLKTMADAPFPYACALDEDRDRLYVSLWAQAAIAEIDLKSRTVARTISVEEHPNELLLSASGRLLYVANANRNTVSVIDTASGTVTETLLASLYPNLPPGSTPDGLALSPDGTLLFVANATIDAVAVFDVSEPGRSRSLGLIPTGWYPTSVRVTPDGKRLLIANGKGGSAKANPQGPQPGVKATGKVQYIGDLLTGTLSIVPLPQREQLEEQLKAWTVQVLKNSPLHPDLGITAAHPAGNPIPEKPGDACPITYCIYVIKENRTYDQVLGDIAEGNGSPALCLFPEAVTPNHHRLARDFVLLDNFYVDAEVSADGHEWSMAAMASDFVVKSWPLAYGHNKSAKFPYPSEGHFEIAHPASGYLWDHAQAAGVSYRSYGEFVDNGKHANDPGTSRVKSLEGHFDPRYRSFDLDYPDARRVDEYQSELKGFEAAGDMPRLQIVRLPSDHTSGTLAGKPTPTAYLAENDQALGRLVEAVSHSSFWPRTAIFVLEDDAQNGPDHVDAHRSPAFVISPYTRRHAVDSTMYSTSSMLRTIELILGLKPMTQYDAAAAPMYGAFIAAADAAPYTALPAQVDLEQKNAKTAWGAKASSSMDFAKEDAADDQLLNEVIWHSVRGAYTAMPAPVRAAFVRTQPGRDDDD